MAAADSANSSMIRSVDSLATSLALIGVDVGAGSGRWWGSSAGERSGGGGAHRRVNGRRVVGLIGG